MRMENYTPFPNLRFFNTDNEGREFGVLLVKGTYRIGSDGWLAIAEDQEPLAMTDAYHGALNLSSLRVPSDVVSRKPRSDIVVNAVARAPAGGPSRSWVCSVTVEGEHRLESRIRVTGPREWRPVWGVSERARATMSEAERRRVFGGWRLSEPEPIDELPIRYELAFGGVMPRPREGSEEPFLAPDERNPIGRGWIDAELTPRDRPVPAPQIEDAASPIDDPHARPAPAGFGAIPPAWMPRRPLGGTFDDHWKRNVWPNWPADYDFAYNNSAHPDLVYPDLLLGDETIRLAGLSRGAEPLTVRLPVHAIVLKIARRGASPRLVPMDLDTVLIDVADPDPERHRAFLSWRVTFDHRDVEALTFTIVAMAGSPDYGPPDPTAEGSRPA